MVTPRFIPCAVAVLALAGCPKKADPSSTEATSAAVTAPSQSGVAPGTSAQAAVTQGGKPLASGPFKITWDKVYGANEISADGKVLLDGKETQRKFEGNALKDHGNIELSVSDEGIVKNGHGATVGKFGPDDSLTLESRPDKTLRVLDDGRVVAETKGASTPVDLHARVTPATATIRRAALIEVFFGVSLSPELRSLLK
jgi:hypothetical protein